MKHPSYSKAKNQYAGRTPAKLTKEQKESHKQDMKSFVERLKKLQKSKETK